MREVLEWFIRIISQLLMNFKKKKKSVRINHRNIQFLAIELFKFLKGETPSFLDRIFVYNDGVVNTRNYSVFRARKISSTYFGSESISFLASKIWDLVPEDIKNAKSLGIFKSKIKSWIPKDCPCRLCRVYIQRVGFID